MKTSLARREFLKSAGKSLGLFALSSSVIETIVCETFNKALAAETKGRRGNSGVVNPTGYYVHLSLQGAPPLWNGFLPLTPFAAPSAANFVQGSFGTNFATSGGLARPVYQPIPIVVNGQTYYMPPVWGMPTTANGGQNFSELLNNMAIFRGMLDVNSHVLGPQLAEAPLLGNYSTSGVVADGSIFPIPAIVDPTTNASSAFRSVMGYSALPIQEGTNPVATLLGPFADFRSGRNEFTAGNIALEEQAFSQFEAYAQAQGITASTLATSYENAMSLIADGIYPALVAKWSSVFAKYTAIVDEAVQPTPGQLPGFFDQSIPTDKSGFFSYQQQANSYVTLTDAREMITTNTTAPNMAANFAIAEILLGQVTASMILNFGSLSNLAYNSTSNFSVGNDQHYVGAGVSTISTTLLWRGLFACLNEFVAQLKSSGMFNSTVIYIASEFNRQTRVDGSGSDHNFAGNSCALISGMIGGLNVLGNIYIDPVKAGMTTSTYPGTSGLGTNLNYGGVNRQINFNDMARTMKAMLNLPTDIVTNGNVLLEPNGGGSWMIPAAIANEANNV